jgi:hypothetical protein
MIMLNFGLKARVKWDLSLAINQKVKSVALPLLTQSTSQAEQKVISIIGVVILPLLL